MKPIREVVTDPDTLYIDTGQDYAAPHISGGILNFKVERRKLEWEDEPGQRTSCDVAWLYGGGDLCMVEEKKAGDFDSSVQARRLQRQLRLDLREADTVIFAARFGARGIGERASYSLGEGWIQKRYSDINSWQMHGYVMAVPPSPAQALSVYNDMRTLMQHPNKQLRILAGDDRKRRVADRDATLTFLRRTFKGVGAATAVKIKNIMTEHKLSLVDLYTRSPQALKSIGITPGIIAQIQTMKEVPRDE